MAVKGSKPLKNKKWEHFAQLVGTVWKTQVDAYVEAVRRDPKQPRPVTIRRASKLRCRDDVGQRITYLEAKAIEDKLAKYSGEAPKPDECLKNARHGVKRAIRKDDLGQLNAHNRTIGDMGGFFKIEVTQRTVIIDESMDEYEYQESDEAELLDEDEDDE